MDTPDVPGISDLRLHKSGHGTVIYLGRQVPTSDAAGTQVAVKVFGDFSYVERDKFTRQWRVSGLLNGLPGIASVHEGGVGSDGKPYVVREFIDGPSLAQDLTGTPPSGELDVAQAVHLITAIADVVAYGHRNGVIHGALKPTNVFRGPDGAPVITDFSLPGLTDHGAERSLDDAALPYIAPEVRSGATSTQAADVYALGAMLYSSVTGAPPSAAGVDATDPAFAGLPSDLARAIATALAEQPQDRPRSAALFAQSLRRAVPRVPGMAATVPPKTTTKTSDLAPDVRESTTPEPIAGEPSTGEPAAVASTPVAPSTSGTPHTPQVAAAAADPRELGRSELETADVEDTARIDPAKVDPVASNPVVINPVRAEPAELEPTPSTPSAAAPASVRKPTRPAPIPGSRPGPYRQQPSHDPHRPGAPVEAEAPNLRRWALIGAAALVGAVLVVGLAWNFLIDLTSADTTERPVEVAATDDSDADEGGSDSVTTSDDADIDDTVTGTSDTTAPAGDSDPVPETIPQPWPTTTANLNDSGDSETNGTSGQSTTDSNNTDSNDTDSGNTDSSNTDGTETESALADDARDPSTGSSPPVATLPAAPADPTPDAAEPEPTTGSLEVTDDGLAYSGPRFEADLPAGWQPISEDSDVGYGYRTRFNGPDNDFLYVDLTPPTHHNGLETIEESAYRIAEQVSSSGPVYKLTIGSKVTYWFEYIGNDGSQRIDVFFTIGDTGYAVVGGSHDDPADAYRALIKFIDSLEQV